MLKKYIPITYIVWWYKTLYQVEPVMWTSITTSHGSDELWCGLFTQQARPDTESYTNTMYVISLSNISIKTNFKLITRVEIRLTNLYNTLGGNYILNMTSRLFVAVHSFALFTLLTLTCFTRIPMIWQNSSAEKIACNVAPFFYHQCGDTTSCIRQATYFKFKGKHTKC